MASRFNADYILNKLYDFDDVLGGSLKAKEIEEAKKDEFYVRKAELYELFGKIKADQDIRNQKKRETTRSVEIHNMTIELKSQIGMAESMVKLLNETIRKQQSDSKYDSDNLKQKQEYYKAAQEYCNKLKDREEESKNIRSIEEIAEENEIDIFTIDMEKVTSKAPDRELNDNERRLLKEFDEANKEIDNILEDVNVGLDQLLNQIDEIGENLEVQSERIKNLSKNTDKLHTNLENANKKLKSTVKKFRSATNIIMDIVLLIILFVLIGAFIMVLKK